VPSYAHLVGKAACPACGSSLDLPYDLLAFQWGYCPSRQPWDELFYSLGDHILWRVDDASQIRAWSYFEGALQGGNLGDPILRDLVVRGFQLDGDDVRCPRCLSDGVAIRIEGGRIVAVQAAVRGCDIAVLADDGRITPRPDWDDQPMDRLRVRNRALATSSGHVVAGRLSP
jgi:hypothetical protein